MTIDDLPFLLLLIHIHFKRPIILMIFDSIFIFFTSILSYFSLFIIFSYSFLTLSDLFILFLMETLVSIHIKRKKLQSMHQQMVRKLKCRIDKEYSNY
jgi:hypothetical protein